MSILFRPGRPILATVAAGLALTLTTSAAIAAPTPAKHPTTAKAAKAKAKAKAKSKTKAKSKKIKAKAPAKADLTLKAIHVDVTDDGTLLVGANLLNVGRGFAAPSSVSIVLSADKTLSDDDELLDTVDFDRINAGATRTVNAEVDVPFDVDTTGDLRVLVCADSGNAIVESSESNNCVWQTITLGELDPVDGDDSADDAGDGGSSFDDSGDE